MTQSHSLDATFGALADPTRRAILAQLARGEASVTELVKPFDMSVRAVSKHLRVLEDAGLIVSGRDAQRRPRRLQSSALMSAAEWLETYRRFWEESLERLEEVVLELHAERQMERASQQHPPSQQHKRRVTKRTKRTKREE